MRIPIPLRADAYTISSDAFASNEARQKSVYNFTNRIGPIEAFPDVAKTDAMCFYGLSDYVNHCLLDPCTHEDIDESKEFMARANSMGGGLHFPEAMWRRVVDEYGGYRPVKIRALPEGTAFFPNEPVIEVESLADGFGELAAHVEAELVGMVSIATARATVARHWFERVVDMLVEIGHNEQSARQAAQFFIHDFGMRASASPLESEVLGKAHLLTFKGTDTFNAAYSSWKEGAQDGVGTSILALAHRNVQGYLTEEECFQRMLEVSRSNGGIASYVADCYDFQAAIRTLVRLAINNRDVTIVARPDSGDYNQNVVDICHAAYDAGLYKDLNETYDGPNGLRFIQGDSMNPRKVHHVMNSLKACGYDGWGIFGVGGYLRNACTRDTLSSAFKLCSVGNNRDVCKLSEIQAKMSIPGRTTLCDRHLEPLVEVALNNDVDLRTTYYDGSKFVDYQLGFQPCPSMHFSFASKRALNLETYDFCYKDGFNPTVLSESIQDKRQSFYNMYRPSR